MGLLQFDGYTASDITYYETLAGLPNVTLTNILIDGATGGPSGDGGEIEVSLDIEMVISMAPGVSNVILYIAPNPSPWEDLMQRMANDNYAKQISCSWGGGGPDPTAEAALVQMATQGQSFFCASGDSDAFTGAISFPADSTNLTAVGGTTLTTAGPTNIWVSETTWNWDVEFGSSDDGVGSSGGVSTYYSIPPWQQGVATTTNHGSSTMRNVPDVALTADNVYVRADGTDYDGVGGTSCAAPLWAAFTALVNQLAAGTGLGPVGFLNPALYTIGKGANYTNCFHDITTGNNEWSGSTTQYTDVAGYDLCTGWGTPTGTNLIYALARAGQQPILFPAGEVISGGNGDGVVDPNECVQIRLLVQNLGATASNITASITTPAVGVTVTQPLSGYPNISTGGTVTNTTPFQICTTNSAYVCGTPVAITFHVRYTGGSNTLSYTLTNGFCPPIASFTATPTNGPRPVVVNFTDTSGGTITNRFWNFGDGATTNTLAVNVQHTYTAVGSDTVTLIVGGPLGSSTDVQTNLITVQLGPLDHFAWGAIASTQYQNTPFPVSVTAQDAGNDTITSFNGTVALSATSGGTGGQNVVQNGEFETGDFTDWALFGTDTADDFVDDGSSSGISPHSGNYLAALGSVGSLGYLAQTLDTTTGTPYVLSVWLNSPDGLTPNEFLVSWNGNILFDETNMPALGWTNLQFSVSATGTSAVLEFGFRDDPSYLGLDDISAMPISTLITMTPTNSGDFVSGVWPGTVTVLQAATNVVLIAQDDYGHSGTSTVFAVNPPLPAYQTWQLEYFGCTSCPRAAPGADPLGDGMSNTNKFLAGFNPTDAAAYLHIISLARQGANMNVTYLGANGDSTWSPGVASRTNVLEFTTGTASGSYSNDFTSTGQTNILSGGTGLGIVTNMVDRGGATNQPARYYRIEVIAP
ncbi:MAG: PKD domain-containing protein [Verrucomicrobiia bacterium]